MAKHLLTEVSQNGTSTADSLNTEFAKLEGMLASLDPDGTSGHQARARLEALLSALGGRRGALERTTVAQLESATDAELFALVDGASQSVAAPAERALAHQTSEGRDGH